MCKKIPVGRSKIDTFMNFIVTDIRKAGASDDDEPIGTSGAGYAGPEDGPFHCGHCIHFKEVGDKDGRCNHPKVNRDSKVPKKDGQSVVDENGCCNFYNPGGY